MNSLNRIKLIFLISFKNIYLNWRHSLATMIAIAAGFVAVSLFDGFLGELQKLIVDLSVHRGMLGHLLIEKKDAKTKLSEDPWAYSISKSEQNELASFLANNMFVSDWARFLAFSGLISNSKTSTVFWGIGYDVDEGRKIRGKRWEWDTTNGKPLYLQKEPNITLGTGLAKYLDCETSQNFLNKDGSIIQEDRPIRCENPNIQLSATTEHMQVNALNLKVAASVEVQLREINNRFITLPLRDAQMLLDTERITRISLLLKDEKYENEFIKSFNEFNQKNNFNLEAVNWIEHPAAASAKGGMEILKMFRALFLIVVAVVASMSVANSIFKSINERTREIGTLRSLGFRRGDIVFMFSAEGFFIALFSCFVGLIITIALSFLISNAGLTINTGIMTTPLPLKMSFVFSTWFLSIALLCAIAFLVSWVASRRAANLVIAETMRYIA